jgi:hypothetical protein
MLRYSFSHLIIESHVLGNFLAPAICGRISMRLSIHPSSVLLVGLTVLSSLAATAATFTITFDAGDPIGGLAVGQVLGAQYAAATGATFTANAFSGAGGPTGIWATNTNLTVVSSTGSDVGGLGTPALVSGNMIRSFNGWLAEDGDASFRVSFATDVTSFSANFAGVATPSSTRIFAFNGTTLLTTVAATTATGQQNLSVSGIGPITSVVVAPGDFFDWVGVDNISFTTADVPEPSSSALMGLGLAAGLCIRKALARRS